MWSHICQGCTSTPPPHGTNMLVTIGSATNLYGGGLGGKKGAKCVCLAKAKLQIDVGCTQAQMNQNWC